MPYIGAIFALKWRIVWLWAGRSWVVDGPVVAARPLRTPAQEARGFVATLAWNLQNSGCHFLLFDLSPLRREIPCPVPQMS